MSDILVSNENKPSENKVTFEQRKRDLEEERRLEREANKREKNSPFNSFVQINKATYKLEDQLMKENPLSYRIWRFLANNMDRYNAVIVSQSTMQEIFEVSRMTLYRAIKVLDEGEYIKIYKSGTSNVYALNDDMVWNSWGSNKKYSKFSANVIISENEQDDKTKKEIEDLKIENHKEVKFKNEA